MSGNKIKLQKTKSQKNRLGKVDLSTPIEFAEPNKSIESVKGTIRKQNDYLDTVLNSLTHTFLIIDANDYTIKKYNRKASPDKLPPGTTCYQLTHGFDKPCGDKDHICPIKQIKKTKKPVVVGNIHTDEDGNNKVFEVHGFPIFNDTGEVVEIIEYLLDITERKQAEEALSKSEMRLRALSEASFESIFFSEKGICLDQNQTAERIFGYTRAEAIGKHGIEWIVPKDRDIVKNNIISNNEEPYDVMALRKNGTTFPVEIQARMVNFKKRSIRVTALRDITKRTETKDALLDSNKQLMFKHKALEEKNIALKEILSQIEDDKKKMASQMQSNIDRIVTPVLRRLSDKVGPADKNDILLVQSSLEQVTNPLVSKLETQFGKLTPREAEISNMIRIGLSTKEIASALNTSWETVRNQRKQIRKKLNISGKKVSLNSFLQTI